MFINNMLNPHLAQKKVVLNASDPLNTNKIAWLTGGPEPIGKGLQKYLLVWSDQMTHLRHPVRHSVDVQHRQETPMDQINAKAFADISTPTMDEDGFYAYHSCDWLQRLNRLREGANVVATALSGLRLHSIPKGSPKYEKA